MKKTLSIIGVLLIVMAAVCFLAAYFFHWSAHSVMDGSAALYARLFRRQNLFLYLGTGSLATGIMVLLMSHVLKNRV